MLSKLVIAACLAAGGLCADLAQTQSIWGQCGGRGWNGPTACATGTNCQYSNDWYSQCLGNGGNNNGGNNGNNNGDDEGDDEGDDDGDDSGDSGDAGDTGDTDTGADGDSGDYENEPQTVASTGGRVITRTITTVYSVGPRPVSTRVTSLSRARTTQARTTVRRTSARISTRRTSYRTTTSLVPDVPSDDEGDDAGN